MGRPTEDAATSFAAAALHARLMGQAVNSEQPKKAIDLQLASCLLDMSEGLSALTIAVRQTFEAASSRGDGRAPRSTVFPDLEISE